jgi:alcohol dehydrogenase (cytochrome c)
MNSTNTRKGNRSLLRLMMVVGLLAGHGPVNAQLNAPSYTGEQAERGKAAYEIHCMACHGPNLNDGAYGPPLKEYGFLQKWGGRSIDALFIETATTMPSAAPRSLDDDTYTDLLAYMMQQNGVAAGPTELPSDPNALAAFIMPTTGPTPSGGIAGGVALPPPPTVASNPLDKFTPVSDEMLADVPDADWLTWRRGNNSQGYSPLEQIDTENVDDLRVAWSWALPTGPSQVTPLVHDGVIFAHGWGDIVQALDGRSGELLWQYTRWLPGEINSMLFGKRSIAIYGEYVYLATTDAHIVALDAKTGFVVWDTVVGDLDMKLNMTGGPTVAAGRVMVGTSGGAAGGNFIVGLDALSGEEVWRFNTIARPGEPGGDSWAGQALEDRTGASSWIPGSYDSDLGLAFFGTAQTYNTGPLLDAMDLPDTNNDALYTDSTLAINPENGELAWYFQHLPNDQWDLDWVYERILFSLPINGAETKVVASAGKSGVHDMLEAETGRYITSIDPGLQDFIASIDPETGERTIDPTRLPRRDKTVTVCPHADGTKNWMPSAYNPGNNMLYVPLMEICMDMVPTGSDTGGSLTSGIRWTGRPRAESDGKYGRLQAINLATGELGWAHRQRAPRTSGILATAGNLVFGADLDRNITAYHGDTGEELWGVRLNDVAVSAPISYMVDGKQYVAVTAGHGILSVARGSLVPEIRMPMTPAATLWVFELPGTDAD